ncbi:hypothetical protein [Pseudorhodoferax aquiterrae]|uniref:hypothetical protein n=1 Tax=Pseudorhodoferax aquiterrae TaxID=747304 RepID=UPI0016727A95|nr:hypothetical protein [Pseudorhodoferax aquiterrae]
MLITTSYNATNKHALQTVVADAWHGTLTLADVFAVMSHPGAFGSSMPQAAAL